MSYFQEIRRNFVRWLFLKSWGTPLNATLSLKKSCAWHPESSTGETNIGYKVLVRCGCCIHDARETIIHELAHVARYRECRGRGNWFHHDKKWREHFINAVEEVTGTKLKNAGSYTSLDMRAIKALKKHEKMRA